jgi:hypothetical protein
VFVGAYLLLLGTFGLSWLLAYLREIGFASSDAVTARVFWGSGLCAAASLAVGHGVTADGCGEPAHSCSVSR